MGLFYGRQSSSRGRVSFGRLRTVPITLLILVVAAASALSPSLAEDDPTGDVTEAEESADSEEDADAVMRTTDRQLHRFRIADGVDLVGHEQRASARAEDTLLDVGKRFAVGYEQIRMANPGVDTWLPGEGTEIRIPSRYILPDAPREGIVVNLAEMRLYHYPEGEDVVEIFPVSIGRMDWSTPLGETQITGLIEDPAWYPPKSIREQAAERGETLPREIPPGPDNPLGRHAILLDIQGYLLHGTNRPWGIGMRATHGCIRLHPHDIAYLFGQVGVGTPVKIVNQPFKAGWGEDGSLYMQAYPFFEEETPDRQTRVEMAVEAVSRALGERAHRVDGALVRAAAEEQDGSVLRISRSAAEVHR